MPNRILRDWTDSEKVNALSDAAEKFFVRLIQKADDFGRYYGDTAMLRPMLYPRQLDLIREINLDRLISECEKASLVRLYVSEGKKVIEILNFGQQIRATKSKFPDPPMGIAKQMLANASTLIANAHLDGDGDGDVCGGESAVGGGAARAPEESYAEIPSWDEWWTYCQSPQCSLVAEWFARDKFEAASAENWKKQANWRAYARRCKGWWESDGRPMTPPKKGKANAEPQKPAQSVFSLKTIIEAKQEAANGLKARWAVETGLDTQWSSEEAKADYQKLRGEIKKLKTQLASMA